jgi:outer membrane protein assembly factor BamB
VLTSAPIVLNSTVYLHDLNSNVYALDRSTGKLEWKHGALGVVWALDATTGRDREARRRGSRMPASSVTSAPSPNMPPTG